MADCRSSCRSREAEARVDLDGGAVYSSASIIKLPILWSFFEQADRGTLDPLTWWALRDGDRVDGTGILRFLQADNHLTLLDLATLMTVVSDNTATNALIDRLGVATIQEAIDRLGLDGYPVARCSTSRPAPVAWRI